MPKEKDTSWPLATPNARRHVRKMRVWSKMDTKQAKCAKCQKKRHKKGGTYQMKCMRIANYCRLATEKADEFDRICVPAKKLAPTTRNACELPIYAVYTHKKWPKTWSQKCRFF